MLEPESGSKFTRFLKKRTHLKYDETPIISSESPPAFSTTEIDSTAFECQRLSTKYFDENSGDTDRPYKAEFFETGIFLLGPIELKLFVLMPFFSHDQTGRLYKIWQPILFFQTTSFLSF